MTIEQCVQPRSSGDMVRGIDRVAHWWRDTVAESFLSVLFPPRCVGCGDFETYLCPSCRDTLVEVGANSCLRCGEPGHHPLVAGRCAHCMGKELVFSGARSAFRHEGAAQKLVACFKFGGQSVLGRIMAELARPSFREYLEAIAPAERILVAWVPSHRSVQRERGYNQAEVLARALIDGDPRLWVSDGLVRKPGVTRHQKGLGRVGRQGNLKGAFTMNGGSVLRSFSDFGSVLLVDDVYTTGATSREVSSVIVEGTGLPVYVFTFSRAMASATEGHD